MIESIQQGSNIAIIETLIIELILGFATSSTLIIQGTSSIIDDANVARESVWLFCPRATWTILP